MKKNILFKVLLGLSIVSTVVGLVLVFGLNNLIYAAEETAEETQEAQNTFQSAIDCIKSWSVDDLKGLIIGAFSFLGVNSAIFLSMAIALIKIRLTKVQQDKFYTELKAKLDAEHQKEVDDLLKSIDTKLTESQNIILDEVKNLDEKKKAEAESNIEVLKNNLENIKVELEK